MTGIGWRTLVAGLVALTAGAGGTTGAEAQAALLGPGAAYLAGGISGIATGELDDRLEAGGYPTFGGTAGVVGIGAYRTLSSGVMLGFEGSALLIGEEEHDGREVGLAGGFATLGVGYAIQLSPRAHVYPRLGVGAGGMALLIENGSESVAFDDVLTDPQPAAKLHDPNLSRDGLVFDFGAGVEFLRGRSGSGALIGLRIGYLLAAFDSSWDLLYGSKVSDVSGGPDATISGVYIRVVVGGAWTR